MKLDTIQSNPYVALTGGGHSNGGGGCSGNSAGGIMISYAHKDDPKGFRFVQRSEDQIPSWAVDIVNMVNEDARAATRKQWEMDKVDRLLEEAVLRIKGYSELPPGIVDKIKQLSVYLVVPEEDHYAAQRVARLEQRKRLYGTLDPRAAFEARYPDMVKDIVWTGEKYVADYVLNNHAIATVANKMLEAWIAAVAS
jgi:hypothetical protein